MVPHFVGMDQTDIGELQHAFSLLLRSRHDSEIQGGNARAVVIAIEQRQRNQDCLEFRRVISESSPEASNRT